MKIAVATTDGKTISEHFGRSPYFAIYEIENGEIKGKEMRENTFTGHFRGGEHHKEGYGFKHGSGDADGHKTMAKALKDCQTVISHGMGKKAWEDLRAQGMEMIVTDEKDTEGVVRQYLSGSLKTELPPNCS